MTSRRGIGFTLLVVAALCRTALGDPSPVPKSERQQVGRRGMVVTVCPLAAEVGRDTLAHGGNAVDAAVATALALAVTWPEAGNIGGGGFMLVRPGDGREPAVVDYRETAPAAATENLLAGKDVSQYKFVGVPGTVAGLALAHQAWGKLPWRDLVVPAARLAEQGFAVNAALADSLNKGLESSQEFPEFRRAYGKHGGDEPWQSGDRLVLAELAETLKQIAKHGADGFYRGACADRLVAEMTSGGGLVSAGDLAAYQPKLRKAVEGTFRGNHILAPPPPSSGGVALVEMLNILENFSIAREGRYSASALHLIAESMRRAYRDRARYLGDPDFVEIPGHLTSKAYAKELAAQIALDRATPSRDLAGDIPITEDGPQTTHFSIVDGAGMAVANTFTLEQAFGSRIVVRGAGFLLNNQMGDFNRQPGVTDTKGRIGTPPNRIAPGKRMLSSMTPTIVTDPDGKLLFVTGSPGGRTIINTVAMVVLGLLEFKTSAVDAVEGPRMHQAWFPDHVRVEPAMLQAHRESCERLQAMGHSIVEGATQGDAHSIWVDPATRQLHGVADPRRGGAARGF